VCRIEIKVMQKNNEGNVDLYSCPYSDLQRAGEFDLLCHKERDHIIFSRKVYRTLCAAPSVLEMSHE